MVPRRRSAAKEGDSGAEADTYVHKKCSAGRQDLAVSEIGPRGSGLGRCEASLHAISVSPTAVVNLMGEA
jgi:hypothetical protein